MMMPFILAVTLMVFIGAIAQTKYQKQRFHRRLLLVLQTPRRQNQAGLVLKGVGLTCAIWVEKYLSSERDKQPLQTLLLKAGYFHPKALAWFLLAKMSAMVLGLCISALWFLINPELLSGKSALIALVASIGVGILVEKRVAALADARQSRMSRFCPDVMDMMVICAESGTSLDVSLQKVGQKIRPICPELADEFQQVVNELRILPSRSQAIKNLANRTQVEELRMLAITLYQAMNYGTSIAKTLRVVASDTRQKRLLSMEERASKVPAKMGLPLILLVLFPTLVLIAAPALLGLIDALS